MFSQQLSATRMLNQTWQSSQTIWQLGTSSDMSKSSSLFMFLVVGSVFYSEELRDPNVLNTDSLKGFC